MTTAGTGFPLGQLVDRLGTATLFLVVALPLLYFGFYIMLGAGVEHTLHRYNLILTYDPDIGYSIVPLRPGIELVALPLAAIASARLRWGAAAIAAARKSRIAPLLPLLGAAAVSAVIWYLEWFWSNPQDLLGIHPHVGVQRWIGVALVAGAGYLGIILFPRLTASLAGAFAGPALFALVGYILFPAFMREPEGALADRLTWIFMISALAVAIAAILTMVLSKRLRQHPLSYALWTGALMLCLAVSGTFNGTYPGR